MNSGRAIIVDIDDCLEDSRPIAKYMPEDSKGSWKLYNSSYILCEPNWQVIELVSRYLKTHTIIFITSREDTGNVRSVTELRLEKYFPGLKFILHMRPENTDGICSSVIKKELYEKYVQDVFGIDWAIDDSPVNIEMWKSLGIFTLQCAYGNCIYES